MNAVSQRVTPWLVHRKREKRTVWYKRLAIRFGTALVKWGVRGN